MTVWFSSDTHFGHTNIIKYCDRPFASADEMDEAMIANWNAIVNPEDLVYHLGDFTFRKLDESKAIFDRLNGTKRLVMGNHDRRDLVSKLGFETIYPDVASTDLGDGHNVILVHDPAVIRAARAPDRRYLCGHVHEKWQVRNTNQRYRQCVINVGVDVWDFKPVSANVLASIFGRRL